MTIDANDYPASMLLSIADELVAGELALAEGNNEQAIVHLRNAVATQDELPYTEPPFWYYPTRQALGAALLTAGQAAAAEAVYREDLETYPHNGWSLYGLTLALREQGKTDESAEFQHHLDTSWQLADVQLTTSRL
jgi:tetratricopeptide (TPR) repeat protein